MSRPMSDPFTAGPGSSIAYADDMNIANPSRIGSPGVASQAQSAPQLHSGTSSGWIRSKTPWYLRTVTILVLIALLLIALALGLGLGLGLNRGDDNVSASAAGQAANTSTATIQSTIQVEETASNSVIIVPSIIANTAAPSTAVQVVTIGGSTVIVGGAAAPTQAVVITVSETVDPSTSTALVTRTEVGGVQTITSVVGGGGTVYVTRTAFQTVTGVAKRARVRRMVDDD